LSRLNKPNEGRLRQIVANAVRTHPEKGRLVSQFLQWQETESDEFTRRAINAALADVDPTSLRSNDVAQQTFASNSIVSVYRYVSDRLRHKLRNTMLSAQAQTDRLRRLVPAGTSPDVQTALAKLNDAITTLGRELEATNVDPEHFRQRSVVLPDWLQQLNTRYATRYKPVVLHLLNASPSIRVFASDYLLEIIFWNIWLNAQQATGEACQITIAFQQSGQEVEMLISDNGRGFPGELKEIVFQEVYSTQGQGRGRGLLEISEAVERLRGQVGLYETDQSEFRIRVRFPLEKP